MVAEVARRKALAVVLEQTTVTDASGNPVDLTALRAQGEAGLVAEHDHEHDHEHEHGEHDHGEHEHAEA
jgi:trigger factor